MLNRWRRQLARLIAPQPGRAVRSYNAARTGRLTSGFGSYANSSSDSELAGALTSLRSRSRQLMRDAPYAKRARVVIVNNVIGAGIGIQAQVMTTRGQLNERVNTDIEEAHEQWAKADSCHTGGTLHLCDLERAAFSEIVTAGEVFIRKHFRSFGSSRVPFALELIEAERVADEFTHPNPGGPNTRLGVEVDEFYRPVAYYVRTQHPGEIRFNAGSPMTFERVQARDVFHLRVVDRWPQSRGEPWFHSVLTKMADMDGYTEAEIIAARGAASYMGIIETPDFDNTIGEPQQDGTQELELTPGMIERLGPGEKFNQYAPNRPNPALSEFMRAMLREVAAGIGVSYESLSRDYSQSNYSSSRLALLDDRDLWRTLQQWWVRSFREPLLRDWMQQAVLSGAIKSISAESYLLNQDQYLAPKWKLRGWSWVDPAKEVEALKEARKAGFISTTDIIAQTAAGKDIEDVIADIKRENQLFDDAGITVDTDVAAALAAKSPTQAPEDNPARVAVIRQQLADLMLAAEMRGEARGRADSNAEELGGLARAIASLHPTVNIAPAEVHVAAPIVTVEPANITMPAPIVNVEAARVEVPVPIVTVEAARIEVPAPIVNVSNEAPVVHVAAPVVNVAAAEIPAPVINIAAAEAPVVNVAAAEAPVVNVAAPNVTVSAPEVRVEPQITVKVPAQKSRKRTRKVTEWTDGIPSAVEETEE